MNDPPLTGHAAQPRNIIVVPAVAFVDGVQPLFGFAIPALWYEIVAGPLARNEVGAARNK